MSHYIASFSDNATELKMFLNEEIARLKGDLHSATANSDVAEDMEMVDKTHQIIERLESFSSSGISENMLLTVLKTQKLVKEIYNNGDID